MQCLVILEKNALQSMRVFQQQNQSRLIHVQVFHVLVDFDVWHTIVYRIRMIQSISN
jgi:hypothetical protein